MALDPRAAAQFDEMFMTMASQHKDIAGLFKTFFGFLHRKTDVYVVNRDNGNMGFPEGVAEKLVRRVASSPAPPAETDPIILQTPPVSPDLRHHRPSPNKRPRAARG
jgi:hypothetical protein